MMKAVDGKSMYVNVCGIIVRSRMKRKARSKVKSSQDGHVPGNTAESLICGDNRERREDNDTRH